MSISMRSIFRELEFEEVGQPLSTEPAVKLILGHIEIEAAVFTNRNFREAFLLSGIIDTGRTLSLVEAELPLEVDTREQGLALLGYFIGRKIPDGLKPSWLRDAEALWEHLPWAKGMAEYRDRPSCFVDREWFRIVRRRLREAADKASFDQLTKFSFDGNVLTISGPALGLAMPAVGRAWEEAITVTAQSLQDLPNRFMQPEVEVSVWEGRLNIGGTRFEICPSPTVGRSTSSGDSKPKEPCRKEGAPPMRILAQQSHERVAISIGLKVEQDGRVELSGQDLGKAPQDAFGSDSYEYWVRLKPEALPVLVEALLVDRYEGRVGAVSEFRKLCERHGVPHEYGTWP